MTVAPAETPTKYELRYRAEAYKYNKLTNVYTRDKDADASLAEVPPGFKPLYGTWAEVSTEADRLNAAQTRSGFLHHFFFPEIVPSEIDPSHCDMCQRIAVKEAVSNEDAIDALESRAAKNEKDA